MPLREPLATDEGVSVIAVRLCNHIMCSTTYKGRSDGGGLPSPDLHCPGSVYLQDSDRSLPDQTGIHTPRQAEVLRPALADTHTRTRSNVIFQICGAGSRPWRRTADCHTI
jgi:hypothetical protein